MIDYMYRLSLFITVAITLGCCDNCPITGKSKKSTSATEQPMNTQPASQTKDLVITRVIDAPLEDVWKAWTDADLVMQWWGPEGFTCPLAKMDVREGGTTLVCMRAPEQFGGRDMYSTWAYTKIMPMQRMEYVHNLADKDGKKIAPATLGMPADFPQDQRHVLTLKAIDKTKTELTMTEYGWTIGPMIEMSEKGFNQCVDKMVEALKKTFK